MNLEARYATAYIQENLFKGGIELVNDTRYFIRAGWMSKVWNRQSLKIHKEKKYMFFLFNDILLYSTCSNERYKLKHILSLVEMKVHEEQDDVKGGRYRFRIESSGNQKSFQVSLPSLNAKYCWMAAIQTCSERASRNFSTSYIKPEDIERILTRGSARSAPSRLDNGWVEVRNENDLVYFYRRKTGSCSLGYISTRKIEEKEEDNHDNVPHLLSSLRFSECEESACESQALMISSLPYCALHQPTPEVKSLLPGTDGDDYDDSFFFDDQLPVSFNSVDETRRRLSSAISAPSHVSVSLPSSPSSSAPSASRSPRGRKGDGLGDVMNRAPMKLERVDTFIGGNDLVMSKTESSETDGHLLPDSSDDDSSYEEVIRILPNGDEDDEDDSKAWKKLWSDEYRQNYYWNSRSGKTTWDAPAEFREK